MDKELQQHRGRWLGIGRPWFVRNAQLKTEATEVHSESACQGRAAPKFRVRRHDFAIQGAALELSSMDLKAILIETDPPDLVPPARSTHWFEWLTMDKLPPHGEAALSGTWQHYRYNPANLAARQCSEFAGLERLGWKGHRWVSAQGMLRLVLEISATRLGATPLGGMTGFRAREWAPRCGGGGGAVEAAFGGPAGAAPAPDHQRDDRRIELEGQSVQSGGSGVPQLRQLPHPDSAFRWKT